MRRLAGDVVQGMAMGKVAFASFIGTAIEFHDFYIYGTAAALVLGGAFFLPGVQRDRRHPGRLRHVRGGVRGAPARGDSLRPLRGQDVGDPVVGDVLAAVLLRVGAD